MVRGIDNKEPQPSSDWSISGHVDDWPELAIDHLDGRLDASTEAAVQAHLDSCPDCAGRLAIQRQALASVSAPALAEVPADLEGQILGELLGRPQADPLVTPKRQAAGSRWFASWAPLATAAIIVLAFGLAIGLTIDRATDGGTEMVADATLEESADDATRNTGGQPGDWDTGQGTADSVDASMEATEEGIDEETSFSLAAGSPGAGAADVSRMANALAKAEDPAYFWFSAVDDVPVTPAQADTIADEITAATGLRLVDREFASGVQAFAAFVPREDATAIVSLLANIGSDMDLSVSMTMQPDSAVVTDWTEAMVEEKYPLAELSATPVETPDSTDWQYTTSTSVASPTSTTIPKTVTTTTLSAPAEEEPPTHVLVVILIAVQE